MSHHPTSARSRTMALVNAYLETGNEGRPSFYSIVATILLVGCPHRR